MTNDFDRPSASAVAAIAGYPAANIGDAQDRLNLMSASIKTQWTGARCAGPAVTVYTREGDNLAIHRALDEVEVGDVLVINGRGDGNRAVFGDLLAEICLAKGVAGVVIDGTIRDREAIAEVGLPTWATGVTPTGPTKNGPGVIGQSIACGGVVVSSGDIIVADDDGVAVVAPARLAEVTAKLATIDKFESELRARIRATAHTTQSVLA
ncbi:RraA family protein [Rhodococcus sp. IEGM1428]|uniref:RraA family protein n=1 Tax=Rhodococcus sp. IEGM1428 TaxID=3392191 RepID=UPI003D0C7BCA